MRPDLPILGQHALLGPTWCETVADAQACIDRTLAG
jgi:hypothetical protein